MPVNTFTSSTPIFNITAVNPNEKDPINAIKIKNPSEKIEQNLFSRWVALFNLGVYEFD